MPKMRTKVVIYIYPLYIPNITLNHRSIMEEHCNSFTKYAPTGHWCAGFCLLFLLGVRARHPLVGPVLKSQHHAVRLAIARDHQNCQVFHCHPILFTDISRVTLSTLTDVKECEDAIGNIKLPATSST